MRRIVGIVSASLIALGAVAIGAAPASAGPHGGGGPTHGGNRPHSRPHTPPASQLMIASIQYDSPGRDDRSNASLNAEWVSIVNNGRRPVNLRGYSIEDRDGHVYTFGNTWIDGDGGRVRLATGPGRTSGNVVHWNSRNYIWNNNGDTAVLSGPRGRAIDSCSYRQQPGRIRVAC
ncbi:lamin tail domain-containing protein [Asanoa sp. NPDC049573]|uniref:lamin tail domain-containing protein n=1 Tax=Asanoa sp. NPDC049573 TaxID=3155396 RepID=UPI00342DEF5B